MKVILSNIGPFEMIYVNNTIVYERACGRWLLANHSRTNASQTPNHVNLVKSAFNLTLTLNLILHDHIMTMKNGHLSDLQVVIAALRKELERVFCKCIAPVIFCVQSWNKLPVERKIQSDE